MRLVSFGLPGSEQPGALADGAVVPLAPLLASFGIRHEPMNALLGLWDLLRPHVEAEARAASERIDLEATRLGPPVPRPASIVGVGQNYQPPGGGAGLHPPVFFAKPVTALAGPHDPIVRLPETQMLDYEAELAIVVGRGGRRIAREDAARHLAGYTLANDVTALDHLFAGGTDDPASLSALRLQPLRGKGHDTFAPTGPCILTADEVDDVGALELRLSVNGEERQRARIRDLILGVPEIVEAVSGFMTLHPGDLILTGTPPGMGSTMRPPRYLREGDTVEVSVDEIGSLRNEVLDAPRSAA